jgi:hypothetical protein
VEGYKIGVADEFEYTDPVDGSVSSNQVQAISIYIYI